MQQDWFNITSEWIAIALLNGVLGGIILVALLWLAVRIVSHFRTVNASTRYIVWVTGLILCSVLMVWQAARSIPQTLFTSPSNEIENEEPIRARVAAPAAERVASGEGYERERMASNDGNKREHIAPWSDVAELDVQAERSVIEEASPIPASRANKSSFPLTAPSFSIKPLPSLVFQSIFVAWIALCVLLLFRLFWGGLVVRRLKRNAEPASPIIDQVFSRWPGARKRTRSVDAGVSTSIRSAVAVGYLHPMVLLPEQVLIALDKEELEQVVLHELAHIRRFDDWTILLQQLIKSILFFHPAIWVLNRLMHRDREIACDDWVVSLSQRPKMYASCLAKLAALRIPGQSLVAVASATSSKKQLFIRVKSILNRKLSESHHISRLVYGVLFLVAVSLFFGISFIAPVIAFAEKKSNLTELPVAVIDQDASIASTDAVQEIPALNNGSAGVSIDTPEAVIAPRVAGTAGVPVDVQSVTHAPLAVEPATGLEAASIRVRENGAFGARSTTAPLAEADQAVLPTPAFQAKPLSKRTMLRWLEAVKRISSSGEKTRLLKKASSQLPDDTEVHLAFIETVRSVSTPSERVGLLTLLIDHSNISEDATLGFLEAVGSVPTSEGRYTLLSALLAEDERYWIRDERVEQALKRRMESINSDTRYQAIMSSYLQVERELKENR